MYYHIYFRLKNFIANGVIKAPKIAPIGRQPIKFPRVTIILEDGMPKYFYSVAVDTLDKYAKENPK
mgnify:CR=1 FL=1